MKNTLTLATASLILSGCIADLPPITDCAPRGDIKPLCNMQTPEDIAALPDNRHLLLAHFGGMKGESGSISLLNTTTNQMTPQYPPAADTAPSTDTSWGDSHCTTPPNTARFSPHGTHLHQLADGRWRYLVVNHGEREAVELFELELGEATHTLSWRGCVTAAPDTLMNDVVGLTNGDLIYSRMFHSSDDSEMIKSILGFNTGELWRWNQSSGLQALAQTAASQPNGLEISADNKYVFANMYMEEQVWKVDTESGAVIATGEVAFADNSAWGSDGRLWIATHNGGASQMLTCFKDLSKPCGASFEIVAMDPKTMATEVVFAHEGAPMGAATVAVPMAGRVYMGSFAGDRMISVPDFGQAE